MTTTTTAKSSTSNKSQWGIEAHQAKHALPPGPLLLTDTAHCELCQVQHHLTCKLMTLDVATSIPNHWHLIEHGCPSSRP